jgi:SsrA-binding protein
MRYSNRDARDYSFVEKMEAGIVLSGSDVKSIRTQGVNFTGAKVDLVGGRPALINLQITPYKFSQNQTTDTTATRPLLLSTKEIAKIITYRHQKYMVIPLAIYSKGRWLKIEIGIGRKLKKYEKREKIKQRDDSRMV